MVRSIESDVEAISRLEAVPTILRVVTETTGLRFSVIARVTRETWTACAVHDEFGMGVKLGDNLDVATTLCGVVRDSLKPLIINHASQDPHYCTHPTPKHYGFESYIAVPIFLKNGEYFGNLCALDPRPTQLKEPKTVAMMKLFANLISLQLDAEERQNKTREQLVSEQEAAELREQFIAVLGHDLRNPLSSVIMGAEMLTRSQLPERELKIVRRIRESSRRMSRLVDGVMDFARAKLGGGIALSVSRVDDLAVSLRHIVSELESAHPERVIRFSTDECTGVRCDRERIGQLLSNLLANALEHGAAGTPVEVSLRCTEARLVLSVTNRGEPIPPETIPLLFRPYRRGPTGHPRTGLGLGLYIVSEIARAHGGTIEVFSSEESGTTFTFTLRQVDQDERDSRMVCAG
ncbi:GAF domain-containing sensor histidine kinase [Vitiosangium sp. GDMCC 1.1324]|uniref:GAF domain-containing sensor histidine kinase n=1 Tax=Vitiosangium sp. (strain GDMCC 1.1324) TaxID=2138576 RepID=UPI000D33C93A|nr:GAF domain-containing sensor histidine kinase [Vitiosangium sp. GDMCC 1.1324]PTL84830.1 histidine kinase [Vitiosangium sp. GDMCC 1.1324]